MNSLRKDLLIEIFLVSLAIIGFFVLAAQKIAFHPVPWKDEPWLMQPSFELLKTGQMAMPMFRHFGNELGDRIFTDPIFTYLLAAWFKCFGFGMLQARLFNLTLSAGVLLLVYLIGRLWGGRVTGAIAITFLICDNNYFTGSRFLRNDFASIFFALAAAFSYIKAKHYLPQNKIQGRFWLVLSGLFAPMSALSHLNGLYIIVLLAIWLFIDYGWRMIIKLEPWIVAISINIIALPYTAYCFINKEIYLAQWNTFAKGRTKGITSSGMWANILAESKRYLAWDDGAMFMTANRAVMFFKLFTIIALLYLIYSIIKNILDKKSLSSTPYIFSFTAIFWTATFFATQVSNKTHSYLPHLTSWFALAIGIMGAAIFWRIVSYLPELNKLFSQNNENTRVISKNKILALRITLMAISVLGFIYLSTTATLVYKYQKYLLTIQPRQYNLLVNNLYETVTPDLVPIGIPNYWHLFAAKGRDDYRAFSRRLTKQVLKGEFPLEQYAFICDKRQQRKLFALSQELGTDAKRQIQLIKELPDTPYGKIWIYYIGTDAKYLTKQTF
jgi:4-amino-4-deoxy-L-arabinose transferase-like glycosyltransferase